MKLNSQFCFKIFQKVSKIRVKQGNETKVTKKLGGRVGRVV